MTALIMIAVMMALIIEKKIKKLEQTILHANVEQKDENPFKGFSRYE